MGFTLLKLHKVDDHGECTCGPWSGTRLKNESMRRQYRRDGIVQPCGNAGKHPIRSAKSSVVKTVEEVEQHLEEGGSIGLCIRIDGLPTAPFPLIVWDCDRPGSYEWLQRRGIVSDLEVWGKRGQHIYGVLAEGVPALRSDTYSLNPGKNQPTSEERPGIDIKVSGLVVTPYSPNKRLWFKGEDISESPTQVEAIFGSLDSLMENLPRFDPREQVPGMRPFEEREEESTDSQEGVNDLPDENRRKKRTLRVPSAHRPSPEDVEGVLKGSPYHQRKRLAGNFLRRTIAIETRHDANTFRVVCTLLKHYFLSEVDAVSLLLKLYEPRHVDADGARKPLEERDLNRLVIRVSEGSYSDPIPPIEDSEELAAIQNRLALNRKKRDARSNKRKQLRTKQAEREDFAAIGRFLAELGGSPDETGQRVSSAQLSQECNTWLKVHYFGTTVTKKRFGDALTALGYQRKRVRDGARMVQMVLGVPFEPWLNVG